MALVDLRFAREVDKRKFTCATCPKVVRAGRKCDEDSYTVFKRPMDVGPGSLGYTFCPGKATWSVEAAELFDLCRLAMDTGIMPKGPHLDDQDETFAAALPAFVERWRERQYHRAWADGKDFAESILTAIFGKK